MATRFRELPSVDRVLSDQRIKTLVDEYSHQAVLDLVRTQLDDARYAIREGHPTPNLDAVVTAIQENATSRWHTWPSPVINATGVILHTNLGRAPLSGEAIEAIDHAARGYSDLELELPTGKRGSRQAYVARLICQLTGAQAAAVVNNNASAVLLGLAAVASGKEVIVSRGEAIEIGGGFRIPDVLRQSGATLVEVGTTNRTYVADYEAAVSENTGAIVSAHASNFRVAGFTHSPTLAELVELGRAKDLPVLHDLGSGCLLDTTTFGLAHEPMPQESIAAGVGMAFFSGDKLLGGPQAGVIVGDTELVAKATKHPLARAVRIDKLSIAALTATLVHYLKDEATQKIPVWRMIAEQAEGLESRAMRLADSIGPPAQVADGLSTIGGGSLPGETLPTSLVSLVPKAGIGAEALAARLRRHQPPVIGRIEDERVLLDPRTVPPEQEEALVEAARQALNAGG